MAEYGRQHYLPQFYLRGFATDMDLGRVWAITAKRHAWRQYSIKKEIGWGKFYYSHRNEDGSWDHTIEQTIDADNAIPVAIHQLVTTQTEPSSRERLAIAQFVGMLMSRVPAYHEYIGSTVWNFAQEMSSQFYQTVMADAGALENFNQLFRMMTNQPNHPGFSVVDIDPSRMPNTLPREQVIRSALLTAARYAAYIARMGWALYIATEGSDFVTSDIPVFLLDSCGRAEIGGGIAKSDILVSVPLSRKVLLLADPQGSGNPLICVEASDAQVTEYNQKSAHYASKALISPRKGFLGDNQTVARFQAKVR